MLAVENIQCVRGERVVFEQLGFCLPESSVLILHGPNGSGKTSLLKVIAGIMPQSTGQVYWHGKQAAQNPEFLKELCFIGHKNAIRIECTVFENLQVFAKRQDSELMLPAAMRYFGLHHMGDVRVSELSAGWQRRVALARLLLSRASLWLLDEPTNFLDTEAVALFSSLVESRVQQGGMVIIASHTVGSAFPAHVLKLEDFRP